MKNYFEDENYVGTILAALLHDIGKYAQKFGVSGKHEEIGESVINETKANKFYDITHRYFIPNEADKKLLQSMKIVKIADWIASSERHYDENQKNQNMNKNLINILSEVKLEKKTSSKEEDNLKFSKNVVINLNLNEIEDMICVEDREEKHMVWGEFKKKIEALLNTDYSKNDYPSKAMKAKQLIRNISDFLRKYTSFSTSAWYYSKSDVSLYAHSKITAALAACLYVLSEEGKLDLKELEEELEDLFNLKKRLQHNSKEIEKRLLESLRDNKEKSQLLKNYLVLIQGNFSGIQQFISTIYSKHALKMLKARSTYLSLLNELIPLALIEELELPEMNIIFSGGGNFEIIAPNIPEILEKIKIFVEKINNELWNRYQGDLFLSINCNELNFIIFDRMFYDYFFGEENQNKDEELKTLILSDLKKIRMGNSKDKKFSEQIKLKLSSDSFLDEGYVENMKVSQYEICDVCHRVYVLEDENDEEDVSYCKDCFRLKILSELLKEVEKSKNKDFMKILNSNEEEHYRMGSLVRELFLFEDIDLLKYWDYLGSMYLNTEKTPFTIFPLGYPIKGSKLLTFEELVQNSEGDKKLAALKLDVDNLGKIFSKGLEEMSFSKYYQLSSTLDLFFKGYIPALRNLDKYRESIYVIFSGGDDAFFVGSWNQVLNFAFDLYYLFKKYSANNPDLNISAAYLVFDENVPIHKVYEELESMIEEAKGSTQEKNKINICGMILDWSKIMDLKFENKSDSKLFTEKYGGFFTNLEIEKIEELLKEMNKQFEEDMLNEVFIFKSLVNIFYSLVEKDMLSRSYLHSIVSILQETRVEGKINLPKIWIIKYGLVRNLKKDKTDQIKDLLWELIKKNTSLAVSKKDSKDGFNLVIYAIKFVMLFTKKR